MMESARPLRALQRIPALLRCGLRPGWRLIVMVSRFLAEGVRPTMAWIGASTVLLALGIAAQAAAGSLLPSGFWYLTGSLPLLLFAGDWYRESIREERPRFDPLWSAWTLETEVPVDEPPAVTASVARSYRVLGRPPDTPPAELKAAYRDLVKRWHPDRFASNPAEQVRASAKLRSIIEAYRHLQASVPAPRRRAPRRERPRGGSVLDRSGWMFATAIVLTGAATLYVVAPEVLGVLGIVGMIALM